MIAAELRGGNKPGLNEALGWIGSRVDDIYGASVGRLDDVWIDPGTGMPRWLLVKEGRFGGRTTLIPFEDATAGAGHVWIPYEREVVRTAPEVEPGAPLTQSVESALRDHFRGFGGAHGERRTQTATPRPTYRNVPPPAHAQPPQHANVPAYAQDAAHPQQQDHHALAAQGAAQQPTYSHTAAGTPIAGLRPNPNQAPPQPLAEAGPPEALGIPVPQPQPPPNPEDGSAFGQARVQPAHDAAPALVPEPFAAYPQPPTAPAHYAPPAAMPPQRHYPQPPQQRPQAADPGAWQPATGPAAAPPQPPAHYAPPQYQPPAFVAPPPQPAPRQRLPQPPAAPRVRPAAAPIAGYESPYMQPPPEPAPGPRPLAPVDHDPPVAIPVIHSLDRPQRVEIELSGELRISGELKGFSLKPVEPDPAAGE